MGSEVILFFYGAVCLSMLAFNIVFSIYLQAGDPRLERKAEKLSAMVGAQLERIRAGLPVEQQHLAAINRRLSRVNNLLAFDHVLERLPQQEPAVERYLRQLEPVVLSLATVYRRRENTQAAYFCYFLAHHRILCQASIGEIQHIVVSFIEKDSLYCRLNALKALCLYGNAEIIVDTLLQCDRQSSFLHAKVLVETLLSFSGDFHTLIDLIWARFDRFSEPMQRALMDYIRFRSGDYGLQMLHILLDEKRDKELRLSAIHYFKRYPSPDAKPALLRFINDPDPAHWEYAAVSAGALASYQGEDITAALANAIHSANWYVRYNASSSLEGRGLSYEDLIIRIGGNDRYAREMLTYQIESRKLVEEKEKIGV
ncbi:MAG TPA: HEAT repeat domain-containing protein [Candidatus Agathobaculum merdigallinarum]|nr:HEAT repeat domain-containing protein [Candidatus Agathobaculum merdigallinarum]